MRALFNHYMPLWLALLLAAIPWIVSHGLLALDPTTTPAFMRSLLTELSFGLLAFWIWALTTNAHGARLAGSSGKRAGSGTLRNEEIPLILAALVITTIAYFASLVPPWTPWNGIAVVVTLGFP